jgi:manganese/iron transport system permease protein
VSIDWLADPWASALMRRAFAEAILTGTLCGALGCFVLVRGLAFLGESVAHTVVFGVVVAFLVGLPVGAGAAVLAALTVALATAIGGDRRFTLDTAIGILLPSFFGAGVLLIALSDGYRSRLDDVLFGSVLGVTDADLLLILGAAVATGAVLAGLGKELVLSAFDRPVAEAMGYRVRALDLVLLGLLTLVVVVSLRAVGNVLVTGLLVGPALTARLVCATFWPMLGAAGLLGAAAGLGGLYLTWYVDVGGGAAIVLVTTTLFAFATVATRLPRRLSAST